MGKGEIQSHLGNGRYSVRLEFNQDRALAARDKAQERADELEYEIIPELEDAKDEAETALDQAESDLNTAIESGEIEAMENAQGPYLEALAAYSRAVRALNSADLELASLNKKILSLSGLPSGEDVYAWCADLTTDLSGEVGTIEIPGERQHVQIRPGYDGAATYDPARDGQIFPIKSTTPAATFYNLAMLPGWQKWRPQYRLGEITALDTNTDTCDVTLDTEASSAQGLSVNQASTLKGIPIEYMTCNSAAFEVGDRVLVQFDGQRWNGAKVVGFESEPKACGMSYLKVRVGDLFVVWNLSKDSPQEIEGVEWPVNVDDTSSVNLVDGWESEQERLEDARNFTNDEVLIENISHVDTYDYNDLYNILIPDPSTETEGCECDSSVMTSYPQEYCVGNGVYKYWGPYTHNGFFKESYAEEDHTISDESCQVDLTVQDGTCIKIEKAGETEYFSNWIHEEGYQYFQPHLICHGEKTRTYNASSSKYDNIANTEHSKSYNDCEMEETEDGSVLHIKLFSGRTSRAGYIARFAISEGNANDLSCIFEIPYYPGIVPEFGIWHFARSNDLEDYLSSMYVGDDDINITLRTLDV